jgi:hypothetical protein
MKYEDYARRRQQREQYAARYRREQTMGNTLIGGIAQVIKAMTERQEAKNAATRRLIAAQQRAEAAAATQVSPAEQDEARAWLAQYRPAPARPPVSRDSQLAALETALETGRPATAAGQADRDALQRQIDDLTAQVAELQQRRAASAQPADPAPAPWPEPEPDDRPARGAVRRTAGGHAYQLWRW